MTLAFDSTDTPAFSASIPGTTYASRATSGPVTETSASFTPPANSYVVVLVAATYGGSTFSSLGLTVADSLSTSYSLAVSQIANASNIAGGEGIFTNYYTSSPGAITVTATLAAAETSAGGTGLDLVPLIFTGAASNQSGAGTATFTMTTSSTTMTIPIVITTTGSLVALMGANFSGATSFQTPLSNTTTFGQGGDANGAGTAWGYSNALTTATGSTTYGWTQTNSDKGVFVALEILPAGTGPVNLILPQPGSQVFRRRHRKVQPPLVNYQTVVPASVIPTGATYNPRRLLLGAKVLGIQHGGSLQASPTATALSVSASFPSPLVTVTNASRQASGNRWHLPPQGRTYGMRRIGTVSTTVSASALGVSASFPSALVTVTNAVHAPWGNRWRLPPRGQDIGIRHGGTVSTAVSASALGVAASFPGPGIQAVTLLPRMPAGNRWRLPPAGRVLGIWYGGITAGNAILDETGAGLLDEAGGLINNEGISSVIISLVTTLPHSRQLPQRGRVFGIQHGGVGSGSATVSAAALGVSASFPGPGIQAVTKVPNQTAGNRWHLPPRGQVLGVLHRGQQIVTPTPGSLSLAATFPTLHITATTLVPSTPAGNRWHLPPSGRSQGQHAGTFSQTATPASLSLSATFPSLSLTATTKVPSTAAGTRWRKPPAGRVYGVQHGGIFGATVTPAALGVAASFPPAGVTIPQRQPKSFIQRWHLPPRGQVLGIHTGASSLLIYDLLASFPAPAISNDEIVPATAASFTATFPAAAINTNVVLGPPALSLMTTFPSVSISASETVLETTAASFTASFPSATINTSSTVTQGALSLAASFPAATITATATIPAIAAAATFPAPAVSAGTIVSAIALDAIATLGTPVPIVTATEIALQAVASFPAPAIRTDALLAPFPLDVLAEFPAAYITAQWQLASSVTTAFNVGHGSQLRDWQMAENPWISPTDGTIRMSESPVIPMEGDSR